MIEISPAQVEDAATIATLLEEVERFYGSTEFEPLKDRINQIQALLFRPDPVAFVLVARDEDHAVGLAAYSFLWPAAGITPSLYLKELYVTAPYRRNGVGRLFMERLQEVATEEGCSRLEWTTDRDNESAQAFYKAMNVDVSSSKMFYRVSLPH